jgi:hypothetical protein
MKNNRSLIVLGRPFQLHMNHPNIRQDRLGTTNRIRNRYAVLPHQVCLWNDGWPWFYPAFGVVGNLLFIGAGWNGPSSGAGTQVLFQNIVFVYDLSRQARDKHQTRKTQ